METKRILIPVAPPQQSSNAVSPISCPHHQCQPPSSCIVHYCDVFLHRPPQNSERHAPGGPPVRPCFAQRPPSPFLTPAFLFLYVCFDTLPSYLSSSPASQWLLAVWGQRSSSFIFEIQCSSQSTMLHYALSLPLMSRMQTKSCFQDSDWNLVTLGQWHVVAHLQWGQIKSGCLH